jgi:hypothetical protein
MDMSYHLLSFPRSADDPETYPFCPAWAVTRERGPGPSTDARQGTRTWDALHPSDAFPGAFGRLEGPGPVVAVAPFGGPGVACLRRTPRGGRIEIAVGHARRCRLPGIFGSNEVPW